MYYEKVNKLLKGSIPTILVDKVFHVGTMEFSRKKIGSYEGSGLSVSTQPNAWAKLARADSGSSLFILKKENSCFLDFYNISQLLKNIILDWGEINGYIQKAPLFRAQWLNKESNVLEYAECISYDEALKYATDKNTIKEVWGYISTYKMDEEVFGNTNPLLVFDLLCTVYGEKVLNIDGVWWDDNASIERMASPRGVIFNSKLNTWLIEEHNI